MVIVFLFLIAALALGFVLAEGWALVRWQGKWRWLIAASGQHRCAEYHRRYSRRSDVTRSLAF